MKRVRLPAIVDELALRWRLTLEAPYDRMEAGGAWVAPATLPDGTPAVLKIAMPHFEGEHEIDALRFWSGDPAVRLLESDDERGAMLLERCVPGTSLREISEPEQDVVVARLLRRLWRSPPPLHRFRPLSAMLARWSEEALARREGWRDATLVEEGLRLFREMPEEGAASVVLATDLHAGNVLRADREPWLVIDPKPFVGDPSYDATQHLLNGRARLLSDPGGTLRRLADLLEVDPDRVRRWTFARAAVDSCFAPPEAGAEALARRLAP